LHILKETLISTKADMKNFAVLHTNRKGIAGNTNHIQKGRHKEKQFHIINLQVRKAKHRGREISSSQYSLPPSPYELNTKILKHIKSKYPTLSFSSLPPS